MRKQRSFLKWAGNKYNCLDKIVPHFPQANTFIEPFTGSATVFLNTNYTNNILAEENLDLINLFRYITNEGMEFINFCAKYFTQENNIKEKYYELRDKFNNEPDPKLKSALFLYLNKHGYNGLCRYNSNGKFNVPFGRYTKPYFPKDELIFFLNKSSKTKFIHNDFLETFKMAKSGDFIYCDPPYSPIEQESNFSAYTSKKFGEEEQVKLAHVAKHAANNNIKVIISNHDTDFIRELYKDAKIIEFTVRRFINRDVCNRSTAKELIAIF